MNDELIFLPVREAWNPTTIIGYLPVPKSVINLAYKPVNDPVIVAYPVDFSPEGTQLSFPISDFVSSTGKQKALYSYNYPISLLQRIPGYSENNQVNFPITKNTSLTLH